MAHVRYQIYKRLCICIKITREHKGECFNEDKGGYCNPGVTSITSVRHHTGNTQQV